MTIGSNSLTPIVKHASMLLACLRKNFKFCCYREKPAATNVAYALVMIVHQPMII